ncbi:MAG: hypothetical protein WC872_02550 [Candidatus Absconditabacterales bacterium]
MKKKILSIILFSLLICGIYAYGENIATLNSPMKTTASLNSQNVYDYRKTCLNQEGNNDNAQRALYISQRISPIFYYNYTNTNPIRIKLFLDGTEMLFYNPGTFSDNGKFNFLSNLNPNFSPSITVTVTDLANEVKAIDNKVGRTNVAGMYVLRGRYQTYTAEGSNSSNFLGYREYGTNSLIYFNKKYKDPGIFTELYSCIRYYVAKCGDGVIDNTNKNGGLNTDGKQGIQTKDGFVNRFGGFTPEVCDDGINNSDTKPGACRTDCSAKNQQIDQPTCTLTASPSSINLDEKFNITRTTAGGKYTNNPEIETDGIGNFNKIPYFITNPNGILKDIISKNVGTFNFSMTVSNDGGTAKCETKIIIKPTPPTCEIYFDKNNIQLGEITNINRKINGEFQSTNLYLKPPVQLIGRPHKIDASKQTGSRTIKPDKIGNYTFYMTVQNPGGSSDCEGTLTVKELPLPQLTIKKEIINEKYYKPGDFITYKITFSNIGQGIETNVIISDYLPAGLKYIDSSIFFSPNKTYNFTKGFQGANEYIKYDGFDLGPNEGGYLILKGQLNSYENCKTALNNVFIKGDYTEAYDNKLFQCSPQDINLTITKTIDGGKTTFNLGDPIGFTILVSNNGPSIPDITTVDDTLPDLNCINTRPRNTVPDGTVINGLQNLNHFIWTVKGNFQIGQTIQFHFNGTVSNDPACVGNYTNLVNLTYSLGNITKYGNSKVDFQVVNSNPVNKCESLNGPSVIVAEKENGNQVGRGNFTCKSTNGGNANIILNCGNGNSFSNNGIGNTFTHECEYKGNMPQQQTATCTVDGDTNNNCQKIVTIDKGSLGGYCGDGILDSDLEGCDITDIDYAYNHKTYNGYPIIGNRLDNGNIRNNKYDENKYYCNEHCSIRPKSGQEELPPVSACFNDNTTVSIQQGERFPFRRTIEGKNITKNDHTNCSSSDEGKILRKSMKCTFKIYNGYNKEEDEKRAFSKTQDCYQPNGWNNSTLFQYFENHKTDLYFSLQTAFGKYFYNTNEFVNKTFGEYKLALDSVTYDYCDANLDKKEGIVVQRVCEVDFAVTKPYIAQKNVFGLTPKATTINLDPFYTIQGKKLITKTDLDKIMVVDSSAYNVSSKAKTLMTDFIKKYDKLAIKVDINFADTKIKNNTSRPKNLTVKKIPNQQIYIFEAPAKDNAHLELTELKSFSKPFTIILKNINLTIIGSITETNGMFLVQGGTISFQEPFGNKCEATQIVQGIFMTDKGFEAEIKNKYQTTSNNELGTARCNYGGLNIKGVLIGNGTDKIVNARRSQLNHRFQVVSSNPNAILAERRNEIFNGASLLIEYSPYLWNNLPPGASEFTKVLDIYKK